MANKRPQRVAWILNHTTLLEFEAKILMSLGFEIYIPKVLPGGLNSRTAVVSDEYDATLSISQRDLQLLNAFNLYEDPPTPAIVEILNRCFDVLIVPFVFPGVYYLARAFRGKIVFRVFGHAGNYNYQTSTLHVGQMDYEADVPTFAGRLARRTKDLYARVRSKGKLAVQTPTMVAFYQARHRIFLGCAYESIIENEPEFFRSRSLFLPLGVPDSIQRKSDTYRGGLGQILFVCPNISDVHLYRGYYERFVQNFGDLPYAIAGKQDMGGASVLPPVNDANILGYQTREQLDALMQNSACMFYHSREPRHLHYHPLEAMVVGLPVIYLSGGVLHEMGGDDQPGLCYTDLEARLKAERLLNGDHRLRESIQRRQKEILAKFSFDYCLDAWRKNFLPVASPKAAIAA